MNKKNTKISCKNYKIVFVMFFVILLFVAIILWIKKGSQQEEKTVPEYLSNEWVVEYFENAPVKHFSNLEKLKKEIVFGTNKKDILAQWGSPINQGGDSNSSWILYALLRNKENIDDISSQKDIVGVTFSFNIDDKLESYNLIFFNKCAKLSSRQIENLIRKGDTYDAVIKKLDEPSLITFGANGIVMISYEFKNTIGDGINIYFEDNLVTSCMLTEQYDASDGSNFFNDTQLNLE